MRYRTRHKLLGACDGVGQRHAERQACSHGGREGTAGPVCVPGIDPRDAELVKFAAIK